MVRIIGEYTVKLAKQTGGKAGKGHNKTSTVQVIYKSFIIKHIRYKTDSLESKMEAINKGIDYATRNRSKGRKGIYY
jgi:hypothetical protein